MIYKKTDKRRLYWLIDLYLAEKITAPTFCDEFYYCYSLELDHNTLSELEHQTFSELRTVAGRFSEFENDHKNYPGTYFTEEQLKEKIIETKEKLKSSFP